MSHHWCIGFTILPEPRRRRRNTDRHGAADRLTLRPRPIAPAGFTLGAVASPRTQPRPSEQS